MNKTRLHLAATGALAYLLLFPIISAAQQNNAVLPTTILSSNRLIRYEGRFDLRDINGPRCAWSASAVVIRFTGGAINAIITEKGNDRYDVEIDDARATVLKLHDGKDNYSLASGLKNGPHTVRVIKRTEAFVGVTRFDGFQLEMGGKILPVPAPKRRIEVIGDSISCGYGNEAASQSERFSIETENANAAYGAIAARALQAEYRCIAWSGKKMWPDNTVPEIYGRNLPDEAASIYDSTDWKPDVIIINLATNDFGQSNPEKAGWVNAYRNFIHKLRRSHPGAVIFLATGCMMSDEWSGPRKPLAALKNYLKIILDSEAAAGEKNLRRVDFAPQKAEDGIGADWHPSLKTHRIMADVLVKAIDSELGWKTGAGK